jgi:predicted transcriptional regulator
MQVFVSMDIEQLKALRTKLLEQTPQAQKLVAILYETADWMTRDELARKLHKNRLTPHDISLLERLAANCFIEIKKRDRSGRIGFEFIYRLKGDIHRGLNMIITLRKSSR